MAKLTEDQLSERLEEVKNIKFALDKDPVSLGLNSILNKLAEVQAYKSRVAFLVMEAMQNVTLHELENKQVQFEYDQQLTLLMTTDENVKNQKSAEQRNMFAKMQMSNLVLKLHHAEIFLIQAQAYVKLFQTIHSDLESANSNLSRQITVLQLDSQFSSGGNNFKPVNIAK